MQANFYYHLVMLFFEWNGFFLIDFSGSEKWLYLYNGKSANPFMISPLLTVAGGFLRLFQRQLYQLRLKTKPQAVHAIP